MAYKKYLRLTRQRIRHWQWLSDTPAMLCWAVVMGVLGAGARGCNGAARKIQNGCLSALFRGLQDLGDLRPDGAEPKHRFIAFNESEKTAQTNAGGGV